jgi:hypothetical protein
MHEKDVKAMEDRETRATIRRSGNGFRMRVRFYEAIHRLLRGAENKKQKT